MGVKKATRGGSTVLPPTGLHLARCGPTRKGSSESGHERANFGLGRNTRPGFHRSGTSAVMSLSGQLLKNTNGGLRWGSGHRVVRVGQESK